MKTLIDLKSGWVWGFLGVFFAVVGVVVFLFVVVWVGWWWFFLVCGFLVMWLFGFFLIHKKKNPNEEVPHNGKESQYKPMWNSESKTATAVCSQPLSWEVSSSVLHY